MAKPPIGDLPPPWGGAGNFAASFFPLTYPWGAAHPQAGAPTPWSNQPRLNATDIISFANNGAEPQVPQNASVWNEWLRRIQVHVSWVQDGSSADDADAHIMETDASGFSAAQKYIATLGIEGAGASPVIFVEGATIPTGKTMTVNDGTLTSSPGGTLTWNGLATHNGQLVAASRFTLTAGANVAAGDISTSGDELRHRDSVGTDYLHKSATGWFKGVGVDASSGPVATASVDTTTAVAPKVTGDVHVSACGWVSRALAGTVTISVIEVGGIGQIGTSTTLSVPGTAGSSFQCFTFDRIRAGADTTPRVYRLEIAGGGSNVTTRNLRITATPGAG